LALLQPASLPDVVEYRRVSRGWQESRAGRLIPSEKRGVAESETAERPSVEGAVGPGPERRFFPKAARARDTTRAGLARLGAEKRANNPGAKNGLEPRP
jgi:hypothetical protein